MPRINSFDRLYGEPVFMNTMMPWEFERLANEQGLTLVGSQGVYKRGVNDASKFFKCGIEASLIFPLDIYVEKRIKKERQFQLTAFFH